MSLRLIFRDCSPQKPRNSSAIPAFLEQILRKSVRKSITAHLRDVTLGEKQAAFNRKNSESVAQTQLELLKRRKILFAEKHEDTFCLKQKKF
jgi:hypothetical protein